VVTAISLNTRRKPAGGGALQVAGAGARGGPGLGFSGYRGDRRRRREKKAGPKPGTAGPSGSCPRAPGPERGSNCRSHASAALPDADQRRRGSDPAGAGFDGGCMLCVPRRVSCLDARLLVERRPGRGGRRISSPEGLPPPARRRWCGAMCGREEQRGADRGVGGKKSGAATPRSCSGSESLGAAKRPYGPVMADLRNSLGGFGALGAALRAFAAAETARVTFGRVGRRAAANDFERPVGSSGTGGVNGSTGYLFHEYEASRRGRGIHSDWGLLAGMISAKRKKEKGKRKLRPRIAVEAPGKAKIGPTESPPAGSTREFTGKSRAAHPVINEILCGGRSEEEERGGIVSRGWRGVVFSASLLAP